MAAAAGAGQRVVATIPKLIHLLVAKIDPGFLPELPPPLPDGRLHDVRGVVAALAKVNEELAVRIRVLQGLYYVVDLLERRMVNELLRASPETLSQVRGLPSVPSISLSNGAVAGLSPM